MPVRRLAVAALLLTAAMPAAAQARAPRTIARANRLDYGPVLAGGRVAYAAAPHIRLVTPRGRSTTLTGTELPSPVLPQPAVAHAATPEGSLSYDSPLLSFNSTGLAWEAVSDHIDPSMDEFTDAFAYFRDPARGGMSQLLGGFSGEGPAGSSAVCKAADGAPLRSYEALVLSDSVLAYAAEDPPLACPPHSSTVRLIARDVAVGSLGAERVLAEAPASSPATLPFRNLRAAGSFVAWTTAPAADRTANVTVTDASSGTAGYELTGVPLRSGVALAPDGTIALGLADGSTAWASPSEPTLHSLHQGRPLAIAAGHVLVESGPGLRLDALDGTSRPVATFANGHERRAGDAGYDGTYATWATRRRVCTRRHRHRHCRWAYRIQLQRAG